ncbi:MAG: galactose mutarotase [Marmoricola sp.]|nr:galactose mutarotase [Marmoricola sp.]
MSPDVLAGRAPCTATVPVMGAESFGESSRGPVRLLRIGAEPGPVLDVLDLGATVHRLWVTGGDGVRRNVVLGHATAEEHLESADYIGGTIGRYANRIRNGRFPLDGDTVQTETNDRGNTLHGGPDGFDRRMWKVDHHTDDRLVLSLGSPAGDQGFPGELVAVVAFEATADSVRVRLEATCDAPTVVNLTSHAYFNLDGDSTGPVDAQWLRVAADAYLPVADDGIPLDVQPVAGTPFDLREAVRLGDVVAATGGLDHNYLLTGAGPSAVLDSPGTRTRLELTTDRPGLQIYSGIGFDGTRRSTTGEPYLQGAGLALEPQLFPDTPNRPDFGSAVLRPGETYGAGIEWRFSALPEDRGV